MLTALHVQNFVLIDSLSLSLAGGLTALTGETGAGKSILLDALGLAAGAKTDRGDIRAGAEQGAVTASFDVAASHPVWAMMEENGLDASEDQVILRRVQSRDGRSRAFVNDQPVSVALLREIGGALIEIHGQHDGRGFLSAATHRGLLDDYAGISGEVEGLRGLYEAWRGAERRLEERKAERARTLAEADYLAHVVAELDRLKPEAGEETALIERRAHFQKAEKVAGALKEARESLVRADIENVMAQAARRMSRMTALLNDGDDLPARAAHRFDAALSEYLEAEALVEEACERYIPDTESLEKTDERLFALRAAARKHAVIVDELAAFHEKARAALDDLNAGEASFAELEKEAAVARRGYVKLAKDLSQKRRKAADRLDAAVAKELAPLKLGAATFETSIVSDETRPTADGIDRVEFMVATNPGAPAGPLKTIASGGELSRFVLAMKAALAAKENRTVIIFDEVDAGVGGAVADAVGERLARLGREAQVLVVTHSPQVAARAHAHLKVSKVQTKSKTTTSVDPLTNEERIEEIARMLSGASVTDAARAAARQLLGADASPPAKAPRRKRA